jgi:retron-type reverse transcriptase
MLNKDKLKKIVINTKGKKRLLYTYPQKNSQLRKKHELYLKFIEKHFIPSKFSHAYTKGRSIYTNGMVHLENHIFIKMDVKNFFPSLSHDYLIQAMSYELNKNRPNSITAKECTEIVNNSSVNRRGLPLGLLPSPILSNIYMKKFDSVFYGRLKKMGLDNILYTRYADDLFISFKSTGSSTSANEVIKLCSQELKRCYLYLNEKKTKVIDLKKSNHVKIAGVNIAILQGDKRRLTVGRDTVRQLYFKAISAYKSIDVMSDFDIQQIKGMHSFILSIEKTGYSQRLANGMKSHIQSLGFDSLESLISSLEKKQPR